MRFEGAKLYALRTARGLTQSELAQMAGKNWAADISYLENEAVRPRAGTIDPIARALGVPIDYFYVDGGLPDAVIVRSRPVENPGDATGLAINLTLVASGTACQRKRSRMVAARMARCIEAAEQTIVAMINARDMDDGTWDRMRASIIRPWAKAVLELDRISDPVARG